MKSSSNMLKSIIPNTILNTIDRLGKFDGKADEGFFVGYSTNSKAFRVFNTRTRIVEENLHVKFSENTPNIAGSGPNWLFDIDELIKSMNYKTVVAGNQYNGSTCPKACDNVEEPRVNQKKDANVNNTNNINIVSPTDNAAGIEDNVVDENIVWMIEAIRLFIAYASFKDFVVYQMDVKSVFLYGKIKEEVYVCQPPGFEDPDFPNKVYKVEKIFRYLKGQPKLGLWYPKDSPFDLVAYTDSDNAGVSLDKKSTTGGCQFLGCRKRDTAYQRQVFTRKRVFTIPNMAYSPSTIRRLKADNTIRVNWSPTKSLFDVGSNRISIFTVILRGGIVSSDVEFFSLEPPVRDTISSTDVIFTFTLNPKGRNYFVKSKIKIMSHFQLGYRHIFNWLIRMRSWLLPVGARRSLSNPNLVEEEDGLNRYGAFFMTCPFQQGTRPCLPDPYTPQELQEFNSENYDAIIEPFSPSPIPVEDSDPFMEEIDLFLASDGSIPPNINSNYSDSEGDNLVLERLLHDDPIPLPDTLDFSNVVRVFLPFFTYPMTSSILLSSMSEDTIFDPGISNYHFSSLEPGVSHRSGTFMKFYVYPNHLNESPMEILSSTCFLMDQ
uniref:Retrovirus-related Pol polyprotein from transposon TNT 1-94 n=1 Tax=Tanacetum cinerariifolium TaxID=118510 RepID=A0A6L2K552_TANCI|nr:retrovirus-related Pol polyprotein from transposon TNT 1-94 [Tanacetum cinerariifolium]